MKKLRLLAFFLSISCIITAKDPTGTEESASVDREQQQLEWCFVYSNLLGYNISYISNPRLYQGVSDWMGTPYKYSGNSKKGVDCSGLVCELYSSCYDKHVTGAAREMSKKSDVVKRSELAEGDLVFFKIKRSRVSHVGIYLGQNKFVHSSTQKGVIISDLDDEYYQKYYYRAGRIR